jgi:hypothetical protein
MDGRLERENFVVNRDIPLLGHKVRKFSSDMITGNPRNSPSIPQKSGSNLILARSVLVCGRE